MHTPYRNYFYSGCFQLYRGTLSIDGKEIEDIVRMTIHELENESSSLDGIDELEKFWHNSSLKILTDNLPEPEKEHLRRRAWEMVIYSCRKIKHAEKCANETLTRFVSRCTQSSLIKSLSLVLLGSTARLEAEIDSDVDMDVLYLEANHCKDIVNDYFIVPFMKALRSSKYQEKPGDVYGHSYQELEAELDNKYERIQNVLLGSLCIHNKIQFVKERQKIKASVSIEELIDARENLVRKEELSIGFKERLGPKPKNFYHAACYSMQILVLKLCRQKLCDIDTCLQPYWKIFEILKKPVEEAVGKAPSFIYVDLRQGIIEAMKIRERDPYSYDIKRASNAIRRMIKIVSSLL